MFQLNAWILNVKSGLKSKRWWHICNKSTQATAIYLAIFRHHFCFSHPSCPTNRKQCLCKSTGGQAHKTGPCAKAGHLKHMAFLSCCDTDWNRAGRLIKRTLAFRRGHRHNREGNAMSASINPEGLERALGWKTEWWKPGYNHCYFTLQLLQN